MHDDPLYLLLVEIRRDVAQLTLLVNQVRDENVDVETRIQKMLLQLRAQDAARIRGYEAEIDRIVTKRVSSLPGGGYTAGSLPDRLFIVVIIIAYCVATFVGGMAFDTYRSRLQTALGYPLLLRDVTDAATDITTQQGDVDAWTEILEDNRGRMASVMRECERTTQTTTRDKTYCTVHLLRNPGRRQSE